MTPRTAPWPHGAPCWAALATADEPLAREFYAAVLGWTFRDIGPRQHDWTIAEVAEASVAGLGGIARDETEAFWPLAFATTDLDASAASVVNAGARLLVPPHEVLAGAARAAVVRDLVGRRFMLLEADSFTGFTTVNRPGALVWEDGFGPTDDADRAFYGDLLGWATTAEPRIGPGSYVVHAPGEDGRPWAALDGDTDAPPGWLPWFGVESVDTAVDAARRAGGTVLAGPEDTAWGRVARLTDAGGAPFGVMTPDWDSLPDRR